MRQRSSSLPDLGLSLVVEKPVCEMEADVMALVSAVSGQPREGGRQAGSTSLVREEMTGVL